MNDFLCLFPADAPEPSAVPVVATASVARPPTWLEVTRPRIYRLTRLAFEPPSFDLCMDLARTLELIEFDDLPAPIVVPDGRRRPAVKWERERRTVVVVMGPRGADVKAYSGASPVLSVFYPSGSDGEPRDGEEKRAVVRLRLALMWLYKRGTCDGECCGR